MQSVDPDTIYHQALRAISFVNEESHLKALADVVHGRLHYAQQLQSRRTPEPVELTESRPFAELSKNLKSITTAPLVAVGPTSDSEAPAPRPLAYQPALSLYQLALVACLEHVQETMLEKFSASLIRKRLENSHGKKIGNITTTMEPLEENGWLEVVSGKEVNKHKLYVLTKSGTEEAQKLLDALRRSFNPVVVRTSA
jgi:DNA-binding MarR family transcriptional regulator